MTRLTDSASPAPSSVPGSLCPAKHAETVGLPPLCRSPGLSMSPMPLLMRQAASGVFRGLPGAGIDRASGVRRIKRRKRRLRPAQPAPSSAVSAQRPLLFPPSSPLYSCAFHGRAQLSNTTTKTAGGGSSADCPVSYSIFAAGMLRFPEGLPGASARLPDFHTAWHRGFPLRCMRRLRRLTGASPAGLPGYP